MDFYALLGIPEEATPADIKSAFREKAFEHHPDHANQQDSGEEGHRHFQRVLEAYETLRDPSKRAQYDALRRAGFPGGDAASSAGQGQARAPWAQRGTEEDDWERAFDEWLRRQGGHRDEHAADNERARREQTGAARRARAWEVEKREAQANKLRVERVRRRTEHAKHARQAAVLRRFWQTHAGLTWQDAAAAALFLAGSAAVAYFWKRQLGSGGQREAGHPEGLDRSSERRPIAAAAAAAAAAAPQPP